MNYRLLDTRGLLDYKQRYNPATDKYDKYYGLWWDYPHPGYYLINLRSCNTNAIYSDNARCDAGAYCPGQGQYTQCANGPAPETYGMYTCPDNTYSDDGAAECTTCPARTGNSGNSIADHAGIGSCKPLCNAGATEFHVRDYVFNIWPNDVCDSPAIRFGLSDGTCCVKLESGDGPGLNVDIDGAVYHTVN